MSDPQNFWDASPKSTFVMGLLLGLAVSSIVALILILSMVWNGKMVGGNGGSGGGIQAVDNQGTGDTGGTGSDQQPTAKPVAAVQSSDHVRGNKNAKVTLIEYSDFECPFCKSFTPSVDQALKDFPNDVRLVYRHYPLSFHQNAEKEAEASECVNKLGGVNAFWKFHDIIFAETTSNGLGFALDKLGGAAARAGVNQANFQKCLDSGEMKSVVDGDIASGNDAGVQGTPATFVNGTLVSGAVPYTSLKAAIQAAGGNS